MKTLLVSLSAAALFAILSVCPASANPTLGASSGVHRAPAFGAGLHVITYNAGEQADFSVTGDHDTTLNIVVKDEFGNVITRTTGPGDVAHVWWTPNRTGAFYIYVVNEGSVYNQYSWRAY
jgi:hypothetical protein